MSDVEREALHDWLDERAGLAADEQPTRSELADDAPQWPRCRRCGSTAQPGVQCVVSRCPWQRDEDGTIVGHEVG